MKRPIKSLQRFNKNKNLNLIRRLGSKDETELKLAREEFGKLVEETIREYLGYKLT